MAKFYSQKILTYLNEDKIKWLIESIRRGDFTFKQEYTTMNNLSCFLIQYLILVKFYSFVEISR